jgi:hypothetical protein
MLQGYAELLSCCWAHEPALRPGIGLVVQQLQVGIMMVVQMYHATCDMLC